MIKSRGLLGEDNLSPSSRIHARRIEAIGEYVSVGYLDRKLDTILAKLSKPGDKNRDTEGKPQDQSNQA
jgi:hypothetical protein